MNCARKRREAKENTPEVLKEKSELEELRILLEGPVCERGLPFLKGVKKRRLCLPTVKSGI